MRLLASVTAAALLFAIAPAAPQQQRDFLTDNEGDQIREAQEPNERLACYVKFARLRLELVRQALEADKPGRAKIVHNNLEDYTHIIEAMDSVIDDALARKVDLAKGVALVADGEKAFLGQLQQVAAKPAKDRHLFEFALKDALEATKDSFDESQHDLKERAHRVAEEDVRDKKKRDTMSTPAEQERHKVEEKKAESDTKKTRKAPTLRRKSEEPKEPQ